MGLLLPLPPPLDLPIQGPREYCAVSDAPLYKKVTIVAPSHGVLSINIISVGIFKKNKRFPFNCQKCHFKLFLAPVLASKSLRSPYLMVNRISKLKVG